MKLLTLLFLTLPIIVNASSFITCDVTAKVKSMEENQVKITVISVKEGHSGFGDCGFKKDQELEVKIENPKKVKVNEVNVFKYNSYSSMGPNGPVSGKSWKIKN